MLTPYPADDYFGVLVCLLQMTFQETLKYWRVDHRKPELVNLRHIKAMREKYPVEVMMENDYATATNCSYYY